MEGSEPRAATMFAETDDAPLAASPAPPPAAPRRLEGDLYVYLTSGQTITIPMRGTDAQIGELMRQLAADIVGGSDRIRMLRPNLWVVPVNVVGLAFAVTSEL